MQNMHSSIPASIPLLASLLLVLSPQAQATLCPAGLSCSPLIVRGNISMISNNCDISFILKPNITFYYCSDSKNTVKLTCDRNVWMAASTASGASSAAFRWRKEEQRRVWNLSGYDRMEC